MRARAIKALNRLGDAELFSAVAEGLALVVKHGDHLWNAATTLYDTGQHHAARILALIVEEAAAKYLILIDAIRCPRLPQDRRACQLGRFNEHLAKGLYAKAAQMRPSDLRQLQEYLNPYRHELYLDGPNDVDWIFRNEIIEERESSLYVDYVEGNDGLYWSDPTVRAALGSLMPLLPPRTLTTALRLQQVGAGTSQALAVIAGYWRENAPTLDTTSERIRKANYRTLVLLDEGGLLTEQPSGTYSWIVKEWQFPMYDLELTRIRVKREELREEQQNWRPDW